MAGAPGGRILEIVASPCGQRGEGLLRRAAWAHLAWVEPGGNGAKPGEDVVHAAEIRGILVEMLAGYTQPKTTKSLGRAERWFIADIVADHHRSAPRERCLRGKPDQRGPLGEVLRYGLPYLAPPPHGKFAAGRG